VEPDFLRSNDEAPVVSFSKNHVLFCRSKYLSKTRQLGNSLMNPDADRRPSTDSVTTAQTEESGTKARVMNEAFAENHGIEQDDDWNDSRCWPCVRSWDVEAYRDEMR
jgi:hypothetical protein